MSLFFFSLLFFQVALGGRKERFEPTRVQFIQVKIKLDELFTNKFVHL
jgi:hypothetical protein